MADIHQTSLITTIHDLGAVDREAMEATLAQVCQQHKLGLVLPVTAADMRAEPFQGIVRELAGAAYLDNIVVVLGRAPEEDDYRETRRRIEPLEGRAKILWIDGPRVRRLYEKLEETGMFLGEPGKGRSVWTAFGYLLGDPEVKTFALHDCDIVGYDRVIVARLCLPMAHPSLDFDFCKAYYARYTDRLHARVARLLMFPLLEALTATMGQNRFVDFMASFRYPLSGEFAVSARLARSNRTPADWGLEVGSLAEVYRNTSLKRVCQVDLCHRYEHKHQELSREDPSKGLMKMATDILTSIFRTLASMGAVFQPGHFVALRSAYLRAAQDAIRKYHSDALINGLLYDRHSEEQAAEAFAEQITVAGEMYQADPSGGQAIPNWTRVQTAFPDFPRELREAVRQDAEEHRGS